MSLLQCYNKGCGQKYNPDDNSDTACQYHPGNPVFHDALKGWSCCCKRSTDFTQFLNFKGCSTGPHSNVKPPEPEKRENCETDKNEIIVVEAPRPVKAKISCQRPSETEPLQPLTVTVGSTLQMELDRLKIAGPENNADANTDSQVATIGTQCKNNTCKQSYRDPNTNEEDCWHHPGFPVFHEGMKYWTCCNRKTSDFDSFLSQEGCTKGQHLWIKTKEQRAAEALCRVDWHQTSSTVVISIFTKVADPGLSYFEANQVLLKVSIVFNKGSSLFQKTFTLRDVINVESSEVRMLGTKVEVNLKKAEPFPWPTLEIPSETTAALDNNSDDK